MSDSARGRGPSCRNLRRFSDWGWLPGMTVGRASAEGGRLRRCPAVHPSNRRHHLSRPVAAPAERTIRPGATAIRLRTASTEAPLRRFTPETRYPAYAAMLETGRAQRSIFLARWLRDRDLQRETESGLNVVENYNGVNDYIRSLLTVLLSRPSQGTRRGEQSFGRGTRRVVRGADRPAAHRRGSGRGSSIHALRGSRR
jgi:hypothetical protein